MNAGTLLVIGVALFLLTRPRIIYADGVEVDAITPAGIAIERAAATAFGSRGYPTIATSGTEGVHMEGSAHASGNARDFRTWHVGTLAEKYAIVADMAAELGPLYDVLLEWDPEHIHAELDPRRSSGVSRRW